MARGLSLKRFEVENINYLWCGAHRIRVEASDPVGGMDPNVFIAERDPYDPATNVCIEEFMAVASVVDMSEYPALVPNDKTVFPFFRLPWMEIDVRAVSEAERVWATIKREVCTLCEALDKLEQLTHTQTYVCGPPAEPGSSESLSASAPVSPSEGEPFDYFTHFYWTDAYWPGGAY